MGTCDIKEITLYTTPFTPRVINANILLTYSEFNPLYYLTDPRGQKWVLQSVPVKPLSIHMKILPIIL